MPPNLSQSGEKPNQFLLEKIWRNGRLLDMLCEPNQFDIHAAMTVAQQMMERYQGFDTRLVNELMALPNVGAGNDRRIERCLEILDSVAAGRRIIMPLMRLMSSENQRVRSKVARILGRLVDSRAWTRRFLGEVDDRTRANILEGLWGIDSPEIRELLWQAMGDGNNRVRGNAILGLYRLGVADVLPAIRALAEHEKPSCRATAAWLMGATGDARFRSVVKSLRDDPAPSVRAVALRALVQLNKVEAPSRPASLEPVVWVFEDLDGLRRVGFDVASDAPLPRGLRGTDVVLTENGELLWDYALAERSLSPLAALFLIFDGPQDAPPDLKAAFAECLEHKGANDRWSVARVVSAAEDDCDELASVPPPYLGPELKKAIARFDKLRRISIGELPKLVRLAGSHGPGRHVVLFLTPAALSGGDLESLEVAALALQFNVDIVSFSGKGNERFERLARKTGGLFQIAPEEGVSPAWMLQVYALLTHRYEVTYRKLAPGEDFRITITPPEK